MKKSISLLACLISMASCSDHKDVFNPNAEVEKKKEEYDKNFPVTDIDPAQDWNTFRSVEIQAVVNEIAGETYTVKIYTENPLNVNSGAMLLAKKDVKNGETYTCNVELGKGISGVYVARIDSKGACLVKFASVRNGVASAAFGAGARSARSVQAGSVNLDGVIETSPYSEADIRGFLGQAVELKNDSSPWALQNDYYKVTSDYSLTQSIAGASLQWPALKEPLIIVSEGATLKTEGCQIGVGCTIVVLGTIEVAKNTEFQNSKLVVFPQGKVKGGSLDFTNPKDRLAFYNAGTVNLEGTLTVNGQRFYNCGNVTVNAYSSTAPATARLVNNGHFYAADIALDNTDLYALCYTHIGTFSSEFKNCYVADNTYLRVDNKLYSGASSNIYLGKNSQLSTATYYYNATKIIAPDTESEQAYIKIGVISSEHGDGTWWVGGQSTGYYTIDIDYASFSWADDYSKNSFEKEVLGHGTEFEKNVTPASFEITPPSKEGDCSGNTTIDGLPNEDEVSYAYYAFEDLGAVGDYDFNDVILKVSHSSGDSEATVELVAAGGTLATSVKYGNEVLWNEVHDAFGVDLTTMVNTGRGNPARIPEVQKITVSPNATFSDLKFAITVTYSDGNSTSIVESVPSGGKAPQYLCVWGNWKWPKENVKITVAYGTEGHSFKEWSQNATTATDWYKHPVAGAVFE